MALRDAVGEVVSEERCSGVVDQVVCVVAPEETVDEVPGGVAFCVEVVSLHVLAGGFQLLKLFAGQVLLAHFLMSFIPEVVFFFFFVLHSTSGCSSIGASTAEQT